MKQLVAKSESRVNESDVDIDWNILTYSEEITEPFARPLWRSLGTNTTKGTTEKTVFLSEVTFSSWLFFNVELFFNFIFFYLFIYIFHFSKKADCAVVLKLVSDCKLLRKGGV